MTSPERGVEWGRLISHLSSWDFANSWAIYWPLCAMACPPLPIPELCGVELSSQLFSDSRLFFALLPAGVGSCFPLSCPVKEGIGDWLSSVGAVGRWRSSQVWPWRQEKCPWPPVSEGWLLERAAAQPWAWGGFMTSPKGLPFSYQAAPRV